MPSPTGHHRSNTEAETSSAARASTKPTEAMPPSPGVADDSFVGLLSAGVTQGAQPMTRPLNNKLMFREVTRNPMARVESGTCSVGGQLLTLGGFIVDLNVTQHVYAYEPVKEVWTRRADMPRGTTHYQPAVQDDRYVWIAGGFVGAHPGNATDEVWRYDMAEDRWESFPPLPELRASCGCGLIGRTLHVFGGLAEDRFTNRDTHWTLDVDNPTHWETAAPMPQARGHFGTAVIDRTLYAVAGQFYHDVPELMRADCSTADQDLVHRYDADSDSWQEVRWLDVTRSHVESATFGFAGKVVTMGGRNNSPDRVPRHLQKSLKLMPRRILKKLKRKFIPGHAFSSGMNGLDQINLYDPATDRWREWGHMPLRLYACSSGIVRDELIVTNGLITQPGSSPSWNDACDRTFAAVIA